MLDAPKRRPWYANAIAVGFGAILGAGTLLGLNGKTPHSDALAAPAVAVTSVAAPPQQDETQRWREQVDARLRAIEQSVARIEGRLEKR